MPKLDRQATHGVLVDAGVLRRLAETSAVVLERIARGGGATSWYYCSDETALSQVEARLSPGSVVSFYFDDRIKRGQYTHDLNEAVLRVLERDPDCVVGGLGSDQVEIDVCYVTGQEDLDEFVASLPDDAILFHGAVPARDSDGVQAITVVIPDADGVIRDHPH
ncbi:MAG: hypothetical protein AB7O52_19895 [Planctomycetota bacterium]